MSHSKQDYEAVAQAISAERELLDDGGSELARGARIVSSGIAYRLADYFDRGNEKFDRARFLMACGVVKGGSK